MYYIQTGENNIARVRNLLHPLPCGCLSAVCSPQRLCGSTHADLVGAVMCAATRHGPPCRAWTPAFRVFMTTPVMAKVTLAKSCL